MENFKKEILQFYNGVDELNQGEIYWIAQFNSTDPEIGYNLTYGGDGFGVFTDETLKKISESLKGKHHSEEHRRKISEGLKGEKNGFFGKHHSEETRRKISKLSKGKQTWLGKHHSSEAKQKISEARKGKYGGENNPMYGRKQSEEAKQKMKLAWQKRKLAKLNQQNNG